MEFFKCQIKIVIITFNGHVNIYYANGAPHLPCKLSLLVR